MLCPLYDPPLTDQQVKEPLEQYLNNCKINIRFITQFEQTILQSQGSSRMFNQVDNWT